MSFISLDPAGLNQSSPLGKAHDEQAVRRAATEFEALLLSQLTASLNPAGDEEEDSLFGNSATGLYQQMFSEQVARTMANNGGFGLADAVLRQLGMNPVAHGAHGARRAVEAARFVRGSGEETSPANHASVGAEITGLNPSSIKPSTKLSTEPLIKPAPKSTTPHAAPLALSPTAATKGVVSVAPAKAPVVVRMELPIAGRISSRFGERRDPIHGRHRQHAGLDIAAPRGTPIAAAAAGTVVFAGRRGGYGNLVEIEHADGRRTRYAHTDQILVAPGDQVEDGQAIATVGSTGRSTGPHLHFEVSEDGARVDPLQAVAKGSLFTRR